MTTETSIDQCHCGRPLHAYYVREDKGGYKVYAQPPIIPGQSSQVWACDLGEARITLGLQQGTLVHDVYFEADRSRDRRGACTD